MNCLNGNPGSRQISKAAGTCLRSLGWIALWLTPTMLFGKIAQDLPQDIIENATSAVLVSQSSNSKFVASPENRPGVEKELEMLEQLQSLIQERSAQNQKDSWLDSPKLQFDQPRGNERVQSIHQRIHLLKEILERQQAVAEANRQKASEINSRNEPAIAPTSVPVAELNGPESNSNDKPISTLQQIEMIQPPAVEQEIELPPTNSLPGGIQILSHPVNSFELANSLFATGSYAQALKSYEALLQEKDVSEHDRSWLLCLTASCYRIQGDLSKAESLYRDLISTKEQSYPADYSKWFLDHLTVKKQMLEELRLLDTELDILSAENSQ